MPVSVKIEELAKLETQALSCTNCCLSKTRTNVVFGKGSPNAKIVFVGEAPGEQEDLTGYPFVGRAGKLLDFWLSVSSLSLESVYIMNTLKCRPPNNRDPLPEEKQACRPLFDKQIEILKPKVLCGLGKQGFSNLVDIDMQLAFGRFRGRIHQYKGIPVIATYHPSYILRNGGKGPSAAKVYDDFCLLLKTAGITIPDSMKKITYGPND